MAIFHSALGAAYSIVAALCQRQFLQTAIVGHRPTLQDFALTVLAAVPLKNPRAEIWQGYDAPALEKLEFSLISAFSREFRPCLRVG